MGIVDTVATLTACTVYTIDANVKTGITSRTTRASMTGLTNCQVSFGIRAMICPVQIAAINRVRCLAGAVGMTAKTVKIGGEATGSCRTALQVGAMAVGARGETIGRSIAAMIEIRIYPISRVNDKRRCVIIGMAGIAADRPAASIQVYTMAADTICEFGNSQGIRGMRLDISQLMRSIIGGSTGVPVGTPCKGQGQKR